MRSRNLNRSLVVRFWLRLKSRKSRKYRTLPLCSVFFDRNDGDGVCYGFFAGYTRKTRRMNSERFSRLTADS